MTPPPGSAAAFVGLAWRNLWRQGRRSLIAVFAVAIVVLMAILIYAMSGAITNSFYGDLTEQVGHVQVHTVGWRDARDFDDGLLRDAAAVRAEIDRTAPGAALVEVLQVPALVAGEDRSRGVAVTGQRWPDAMRAAFRDEHLAAGDFLAPGSVDGILLGRSLAAALELAPGDDVFVYAPGTEGYGAAAYTLRGLLDFTDPGREIAAAYLTLDAAQELAAPDAVSHLELHYPEVRTLQEDPVLDGVVAALQRELGPRVAVEGWRQVDPALVTVLNFIVPIMTVYSVIFFLLAGLLVLNTVYLSTLERVREFGVILALGARGRQVMAMVTLESVLMCLLGALLGLAAGLGLVELLSDGFIYPGQEEVFAEMGLDPVLYPFVEPWQVALALGFAVLTAIGAALWPARLAAAIEPAEAMRHTA